MGYSFQLAARVLLYAPSHRQNRKYHGPGYTGRGALVGMRNSSMGPPCEFDPTTHRFLKSFDFRISPAPIIGFTGKYRLYEEIQALQ